MRWLWIDRFLAFDSGKSARALKMLSRSEEVFAEHLPGFPIFPAPLILEGLAQTGGILVGEANDFQEKVVLAKLPKAKFYREVLAGEQLIYEVELNILRPEGASVQARAFAGEPHLGPDDLTLVVEADIFFAHLDRARSQQLFGNKNFVFTGEMRHLLGRFLPEREFDGVKNSLPVAPKG